MTVTLDWTIAAGLLVWTALAFWLGRASGDGGRDLMGPPPGLTAPLPPAAQPFSPATATLSAAAPGGLRPDQLEAINSELVRGNKIAAIKLYREATGLGLLEAKEAIEAIAG